MDHGPQCLIHSPHHASEMHTSQFTAWYQSLITWGQPHSPPQHHREQKLGQPTTTTTTATMTMTTYYISPPYSKNQQKKSLTHYHSMPIPNSYLPSLLKSYLHAFTDHEWSAWFAFCTLVTSSGTLQTPLTHNNICPMNCKLQVSLLQCLQHQQ